MLEYPAYHIDIYHIQFWMLVSYCQRTIRRKLSTDNIHVYLHIHDSDSYGKTHIHKC